MPPFRSAFWSNYDRERQCTLAFSFKVHVSAVAVGCPSKPTTFYFYFHAYLSCRLFPRNLSCRLSLSSFFIVRKSSGTHARLPRGAERIHTPFGVDEAKHDVQYAPVHKVLQVLPALEGKADESTPVTEERGDLGCHISPKNCMFSRRIPHTCTIYIYIGSSKTAGVSFVKRVIQKKNVTCVTLFICSLYC